MCALHVDRSGSSPRCRACRRPGRPDCSRSAARSTPAAVRALAAARFALAQAAAGNARGFHTAADEARALLDTPGVLDGRPPYLTWFGPGALEGDLARARSPWPEPPPGKAPACSMARRRCSAAPPPIPPAPRAAPCITPRGCPGLMSQPVIWTGRYPPTHRTAPAAHRALLPLRASAAPAGSRPHRPATPPPPGGCPIPTRPTPRHPRRLTHTNWVRGVDGLFSVSWPWWCW